MAFSGSVATLNAVLWTWFLGWAIALSIVDFREHRLPNRMVAACLVGCVLIASASAVISRDWTSLLSALGAALAAVAAFGVVHVLGGMGMGDVKYAAVTGLVLGTIGWSAVWWGHFLGFLLAGGVVALGLATRAIRRGSAIPFGPFMAAGTLAVGLGSVITA